MKRYGTVHRCVSDECGWQIQVPNGDGQEYPPLPPRRPATVRPLRPVRGKKPVGDDAAGDEAPPAKVAARTRKTAKAGTTSKTKKVPVKQKATAKKVPAKAKPVVRRKVTGTTTA